MWAIGAGIKHLKSIDTIGKINLTKEALGKFKETLANKAQKAVKHTNSSLIEHPEMVTTEGFKMSVSNASKETGVLLNAMDQVGETAKNTKGASGINEVRSIESLKKDKIVYNAIKHKAEDLLVKNKKTFDKMTELNQNVSNKMRPRARSFGIPDDKLPGLWAKSEIEYDHIRSLKGDVAKIVQNTSLPEEVITKVKQHVFYDTHELIIDIKNNTPVTGIKQFDANHNISAAWNRLIEGNFTSSDILLLEHEYAEAMLMNELKMPYSDAHVIANKYYDWDKSLLRG